MGEGAPRDGAPDAGQLFTDLYERTSGRLVTQLFLVTGDVEEARDCVQESFARAWLRWDRLLESDGEPAAWIYTVAYRIAVSRFRRRLARDRALRGAAEASPLPGPSPDVVAVRDALARLPQGPRAALVLHYYEGLTVNTIARVLGVTPSAVKARLMRGRAALQPMLTDRQTPPSGLSTAGARR